MKLEWLAGGGKMARVIAELDWAKTPLGPLEAWPQSLRTTVSLCLASNFPINIIWGDSHNQIYNDGYRIVCGGVHPRAMGEDYRVTWASAWPAIGKPFEAALEGKTSYLENQRMFLERNGYPEETFFTFSLSPIRDEAGKVVGLFHPVTETTATMLAERRTRTLRDIADRAGRAAHFSEACTLLLDTLRSYDFDLPFAILYTTSADGTRAEVAGTTTLAAETRLAPPHIALDDESPSGAWPLQGAVNGERLYEVSNVRALFGEVVVGPYPDPIEKAFVLPVRAAGVDAPIGYLVVGASTRLPLDDSYRTFFTMLGAASSSALGNARAYEAERSRAEALSELDRAKTTFFSNVSHEFRTPLTLLLGPVEDLLSGLRGALSEPVRAELDVVHRNGLRLLKLVNALLEFSRVEARRSAGAFQSTNLAALTGDLASAFRSAIERAGVRFVVDLDPSLSAVPVDRDMWEKIVLNLLSNAFKFTTRGEIRITLRPVESYAELSVADTGIGIAEDEIGRVFLRFHRVQGAAGRTHEGSGIGLALVQDLAKLHGGSADVQSTLGQGTTFTVRIPLTLAVAHPASLSTPSASRAPTMEEVVAAAKGRADASRQTASAFVEEALRWIPQTEEAQPDAAAADPSNDRPLVLLADDNADMRDYVRRLLATRYRVVAVANGREALEAAKNHAPDLLLSDLMMPDMNGAELVRALRADPSLRTLPIILLSARAGEDAMASGLELGADDYLTKPFVAKELLARVATHLKMSILRKHAAEQEALAGQLTQQNSWLEGVLDRLPVPTLVLDPSAGALTFANRAANRLAGGTFPADLGALRPATPLRIKGSLASERVRKASPEASPVDRIHRGERIDDLEAEWRTGEGHLDIVIDADIVPATGSLPARQIIALRDISRFKQIERELAGLVDARDEFLAIASHELRTPLTSLKLQVQLAERRLGKNDAALPPVETYQRMVSVLTKQVDRLTDLVDNLLDVGRIRSGQLHLTLAPIDLVPLTRAALDRASSTLAKAGCPVTLVTPETMTGTWDARRLEQVLTNLLENAAKYASNCPLHVTLAEEASGARLEVRDFGGGIPEAQRSTIFDRFDRAGVSRNAAGLGLGLFIARQLIRAHEGTIAVEAPEGGGTSFVICLPTNLAPSSPDAAAS